jgi:hypothetical protein
MNLLAVPLFATAQDADELESLLNDLANTDTVEEPIVPTEEEEEVPQPMPEEEMQEEMPQEEHEAAEDILDLIG